MFAHYLFQRDGLGASRADDCQFFFRVIDVFEILEMLEDSFAGVVGLGATGALGEFGESFFNVVGKADGEHRWLLLYNYSTLAGTADAWEQGAQWTTKIF